MKGNCNRIRESMMTFTVLPTANAIWFQSLKSIKCHHFHYSRAPGLCSWSAVNTNALDELYDDDFGITELNWTLTNAYITETVQPLFSFARPTFRYRPRIFSFNDFPLQLQAPIVAREATQQVLNTLNLLTYHYREYLTLVTAWEQIGIPPGVSQLLLPSLNEPRRLVFNPNLGRYTVRFGIRTYFGDLPRRYVNNGVFDNKYEYCGVTSCILYATTRIPQVRWQSIIQANCILIVLGGGINVFTN